MTRHKCLREYPAESAVLERSDGCAPPSEQGPGRESQRGAQVRHLALEAGLNPKLSAPTYWFLGESQ